MSSRGLTLFRLCNSASRTVLSNSVRKTLPAKQQIRHGSDHPKWYYRQVAPKTQKDEKYATALAAMVWWWILWHVMTEYHELFPAALPDPSKWTDEELGIPPLEK